MKKTRKIFAVVLALVMCLAMALPAMAAEKIHMTVPEGQEDHVYVVYQVFTGTVAKDGVTLSDVKYGKSYKDKEEGAPVDPAELEGIGTDGEEYAKRIVAQMGTEYGKLNSENNFTLDVPAGYYLIVDDTDQKIGDRDAFSAYIVEVVGTAEIKPKSEVPSVDKQVQDEVADADSKAEAEGWGDTADHNIGESFKFKLKATLPGKANRSKYTEGYDVTFQDTMSNGVTFEEIESVTVTVAGNDGEPVTKILTPEQYLSTASANQKGGPWSLTIENLQNLITNIDNEIVIEVVYKAHLNEDAIVGGGAIDTTNNNSVYLEYSNNPYAEGKGKSNEDKVYVFTFKIDAKKVIGDKNDEDKDPSTNEALEGAGFKLQDQASGKWAILDPTTGKITGWAESKDGGTEIKSGSEGTFSISGLDEGSYTLTETTTPDGYNTCDDQTIKIDATHSAEAGATVTEGDALYVIENFQGTLLPETGGIGTTIFYVVGICLVVVAGVILVTRKRVGKNS